jgi:hypothetical protein
MKPLLEGFASSLKSRRQNCPFWERDAEYLSGLLTISLHCSEYSEKEVQVTTISFAKAMEDSEDRLT